MWRFIYLIMLMHVVCMNVCGIDLFDPGTSVKSERELIKCHNLHLNRSFWEYVLPYKLTLKIEYTRLKKVVCGEGNSEYSRAFTEYVNRCISNFGENGNLEIEVRQSIIANCFVDSFHGLYKNCIETGEKSESSFWCELWKN